MACATSQRLELERFARPQRIQPIHVLDRDLRVPKPGSGQQVDKATLKTLDVALPLGGDRHMDTACCLYHAEFGDRGVAQENGLHAEWMDRHAVAVVEEAI